MGSPCGSKGLHYKRANFVSTFFIRPQVFDEINTNLKKLWEVENSGIEGSRQESLTTEERKALTQAQKSLKFEDGRYEIGVPWKSERPVLPDNYMMALKRLENTEKKLLKSREVANDYQSTIESYLQEGYIRKVLESELQQTPGWFLRHFLVIRPERATTK